MPLNSITTAGGFNFRAAVYRGGMMKRVSIPGAGFEVSAMALGNGAFKPGRTIGESDRLYEMFRAAGGDLFDTAHCYSFWLPNGDGAGERGLGACIRRHGDVGKVRVVTKGGHPAVLPGYPRPDRYLSAAVVAKDIQESLKRLGMERVDLYLLHRDDRCVPVGEIVDMLHEHVAAGRLGAIGVSNWTTERIAAANAYAREHGRLGFVVTQPQFSLAKPNAAATDDDAATRFLGDEELVWHERAGMVVMAYSPTAGGYFASDGELAARGYDNAVSRGRLERANILAQELGVTPHQVALAYVMKQKFAGIPILGTGSAEHLQEGLGAAAVELSEERVRWLREG